MTEGEHAPQETPAPKVKRKAATVVLKTYRSVVYEEGSDPVREAIAGLREDVEENTVEDTMDLVAAGIESDEDDVFPLDQCPRCHAPTGPDGEITCGCYD